MNVFLIGYMGCGKSTVGEILALKLERRFIDFDAFLEAEFGMSVSEIFKQKGEIFFRKQERFYLDHLLEFENCVVALGGGTPCYGDNMAKLINSSKSKVIYLKASVNTLTERLFLEKSQRPLISHLNSKELLNDFIRKHLFERNFYYSQAHVTINIDELSPVQVSDKIIEVLA